VLQLYISAHLSNVLAKSGLNVCVCVYLFTVFLFIKFFLWHNTSLFYYIKAFGIVFGLQTC